MTAARASVQLSHRSPRATLFALAIVFAFTLGCQSANSARGVVDRFIHQYYVIIDLKAAEPYCTGLALDKLHHEIELTAGQKIDANTRKPTVHYKLKAQRDAPDHVEFLFRATIDVPEGGSFERNWMITARRDANAWKVSNFGEYE
jgi:hypothetical protein